MTSIDLIKMTAAPLITDTHLIGRVKFADEVDEICLFSCLAK